jgi:hypothetical protein
MRSISIINELLMLSMINKTNNHLSPQIIEIKKDHDKWHWKSRFWLETGTESVAGLNQ